MKYKVLALDLDGTLLDDKKNISEENKKFLNKLTDKNIQVIFTTGRGIQRVTHFYNELKLNSPLVLLNGADIRINSNEILKRSFINPEDIIKLHSLAIDKKVNFWGYSEDNFVKKKDWNASMFDKRWMKFGFAHSDKEVINNLREEIKMLVNIEMTNSTSDNIECSKKGINKKTGMKFLAKHLKINMKDIIAVGDSMNDYKLIKEVGLGVAMANSEKKLGSVADRVTKSNTNHGVAEVIKKYIL